MVTTMFKKGGKRYTGATHKMPDGSVHSGKTHTASSQKLFPTEEKAMKDMKGMKGMKSGKPMPPKKKAAAKKKPARKPY